MRRKTLNKALNTCMECFLKAARSMMRHDGVEHAGYLAFLGLLSFFPFLIFFVSITGLLGQSKMGDQLVILLTEHLPHDFVAALLPRIEEIVSGPPQGIFTFAILATIWTASSAVEGTRTILNRAYHVSTPPAYVMRRLLSIVQFIGLTLGIFIAMAVLIFAPVVVHGVSKFLHIEAIITPIWNTIRVGFSGLLLAFMVSLSYYWLPNINQTWKRVLPGTFMVLVGWMLMAVGFSIYLKNFAQVNVVYGSLQGIIIAILFFYLVAVIYIYGAEFNYQVEHMRGHRIEEKEEDPQGKVVVKTTVKTIKKKRIRKT
ncbi:MAG: YihY/virulence factor BrkB family protein [Proteobacteria bacterium]|nr:YihY/virulence factor BrkB family protein [Pseudomonadota bacterium]